MGPGHIGALLAQLTISEHRLGGAVLAGEVALSMQFGTSRPERPRREDFEVQRTARLMLGRGMGWWEILIASLWSEGVPAARTTADDEGQNNSCQVGMALGKSGSRCPEAEPG
jgi:hypothetical protein